MDNLGGLGVMAGPGLKVECGADAKTIGEAAIAAMKLSRFEEWDGRRELKLPDAAKAAGFKSHGDLERGAALLGACISDDGVEVTAWMAEKGGSWAPLPEGKRTCPLEAAEVGRLVLELEPLCKRRESPPRKRVVRKKSGEQDGNDSGDLPIAFGYKRSWIAVASGDAREVADKMELKGLAPCSWKEGLRRAYDHEGVFITPPIDGWVLAVGSLPDAERGRFLPLLEQLSGQFGKAFYFGTHRIVGYQAWARAENGAVSRAFGYLGERGEVLLDVGARSQDEIELDVGTGDEESLPDEESVLELASRWVLDPRELDQHLEARGPGWFGAR